MQAHGVPAEYDGEGNVTRAERPGQPSAAMFLLKAWHGCRDQGEPPTGNATAAVQILMPAQLSLDQQRSFMAQGAVIHQPVLTDLAA